MEYRIKSLRLPHWHYGDAAFYFITICTDNWRCWFGEIKDDAMHLSDLGKRVEFEWLRTFQLRQDMNLYRGEFIVMPNHFHAIIGIGENQYNRSRNTNHFKNQFACQSKNLASIIRGFKSAVTVYAHNKNLVFRWQPSYYDHVIRNAESLERISDYIRSNPSCWKKDRFNKP